MTNGNAKKTPKVNYCRLRLSPLLCFPLHRLHIFHHNRRSWSIKMWISGGTSEHVDPRISTTKSDRISKSSPPPCAHPGRCSMETFSSKAGHNCRALTIIERTTETRHGFQTLSNKAGLDLNIFTATLYTTETRCALGIQAATDGPPWSVSSSLGAKAALPVALAAKLGAETRQRGIRLRYGSLFAAVL